MRKSSKFIVIAGALAALAVPSVASASVNVDDAGNGFVGKGDVQNALGLANDAAMQAKFLAGEVKFTSLYTMHASSDWKCGGKDYNTTTDLTYNRPVNAKANTNSAGKLTNGWNLNGADATTWGDYVSYKQSGAIYPGYCPAGEEFVQDSLTSVNTNLLSGLAVNDIALPNTPVEAAPVA